MAKIFTLLLIFIFPFAVGQSANNACNLTDKRETMIVSMDTIPEKRDVDIAMEKKQPTSQIADSINSKNENSIAVTVPTGKIEEKKASKDDKPVKKKKKKKKKRNTSPTVILETKKRVSAISLSELKQSTGDSFEDDDDIPFAVEPKKEIKATPKDTVRRRASAMPTYTIGQMLGDDFD